MVRLKGVKTTSARYAGLYFNSTMVRLKVYTMLLRSLYLINFNSTMVRLKVIGR